MTGRIILNSNMAASFQDGGYYVIKISVFGSCLITDITLSWRGASMIINWSIQALLVCNSLEEWCQTTTRAHWWHHCCETQHGVQCRLVVYSCSSSVLTVVVMYPHCSFWAVPTTPAIDNVRGCVYFWTPLAVATTDGAVPQPTVMKALLSSHSVFFILL